MASDLADRRDSWAEAASAGSADPRAGCHPSCCQPPMVEALGPVAARSAREHPIADLADHRRAHLAGMLAGARPAEVERRLGLAGHWLAGL